MVRFHMLRYSSLPGWLFMMCGWNCSKSRNKMTHPYCLSSHYFTYSGTENISVFAWGSWDQLGSWFSTMGKLSSFINPFLESNFPIRYIYIYIYIYFFFFEKKLTSAVDVLIISLDMPRTILKPTWNQQWKQGSWCFHTKSEHCHCLVFSTKKKQALKAKQHFKRHPGGSHLFFMRSTSINFWTDLPKVGVRNK